MPVSGPTTLFIFPHAGGSPTYYVPFAKAFTNDVKRVAVQYRGWDGKHDLSSFPSIPDQAARVSERLLVLIAIWKYRYFKPVNRAVGYIAALHRFVSIRGKSCAERSSPTTHTAANGPLCRTSTTARSTSRTFTCRPPASNGSSRTGGRPQGTKRVEPLTRYPVRSEPRLGSRRRTDPVHGQGSRQGSRREPDAAGCPPCGALLHENVTWRFVRRRHLRPA